MTPDDIDLINANDRLLSELESIIGGAHAEFCRARELHTQVNHQGGRRFKPEQLNAVLKAAIGNLAQARQQVRDANRILFGALSQITEREEQQRRDALSIDLSAIGVGT